MVQLYHQKEIQKENIEQIQSTATGNRTVSAALALTWWPEQSNYLYKSAIVFLC